MSEEAVGTDLVSWTCLLVPDRTMLRLALRFLALIFLAYDLEGLLGPDYSRRSRLRRIWIEFWRYLHELALLRFALRKVSLIASHSDHERIVANDFLVD